MNAALVILAAAVVAPVCVIECRRYWRDLFHSGHGHVDYRPSFDGAPGKTVEISPSVAAVAEDGQ